MNQTELKIEVLKFMKKYGSTQAFIAEKTKVSRPTINMWLKGKKELPQPIADRLQEWLILLI